MLIPTPSSASTSRLNTVPLSETELVIDKRREREGQRFSQQQRSYTTPRQLYQHMVRLINQFIHQVMGREQQEEGSQTQTATEKTQATTTGAQTRVVRGIADRMPRLVDPQNPFPARDSIFLGAASDYPEAVLAIQYNDQLKAVVYEGSQLIARGVQLDTDRPMVAGKLILTDGSTVPIQIQVIMAI